MASARWKYSAPYNRPWGPRGKQRYSFTLSSTSVLDGDGSLTARPGRFTPGKESRHPLYRRLSGPRECLSGCRKSRPHWDSILRPSNMRTYQYASRKYPNCYSNSLTYHLFCSVLLPLFTVVGMDCCEEDWYASDNNLRGTPRGSRKKPNAGR